VSELAGVRVLLGVTGGIAAYKAAAVARLLVGAGASVDPVLTAGARRFVGDATFEGITGRRVRADVWDDIPAETHVALGRAADVALVYPATAHTLAKLAVGLADDLLTTTLLAATCPLVVAPAMHTEMWQHAATRHNVEVLRSRGVHVLGPDHGPLMGGDTGPGRVVAPEVAVEALAALVGAAGHAAGAADAEPGAGAGAAGPGATRAAVTTEPAAGDLAGRTVVVTAGGTREPIDPVRFLGNRSSGRMGVAIAGEAARRGAVVHLVAAPTHLATPAGVARHDVTTALEMRDVVLDLAAGADVVVKAAAVADFRPATPATSKVKKDAGVPTIELVANPDILAELGASREPGARPLLVGFAAETDDVEAYGRAKLERKRADLLVVNDVSASDAGFEVDTNRVVILGRDGARVEVPLAAKDEVARRILDEVVTRL
jgi:phosphopantothenoylcysteine decarboxylase / phosphopantothenate---cysteine ligase